MTERTRLLRTPRPKPDESLLGYVIRLAEANHYDSASWVTNLAGLRVNFARGGWMTLNRDDIDLTSLACLAGIHTGQLEALRYEAPRWGRALSFRGVSLPPAAVKFSHPKVCPVCLLESNYCRSMWELLPFTACPAHEIILIDICPGCARRVSWMRNKVSRCRCGFDWRDAAGVQANSEDLKASRRISELYDCAALATNEGAGKEPLYGLDLGRLCEALCLVADHYRWMKEGARFDDEAENAACHDAFSYAFSTLEEWPRRFENFLAEYGLEKEGGSIDSAPILRMHRQCRDGALDFMTVALEEFIEDAWSRYADVLSSMRALSRRFIRVGELNSHLTVCPGRVNGLVRRGLIRVYMKANDGGDEMLIDLKSIDRLKEKLKLLLTGDFVAGLLGIDTDGLIDLVRRGCLHLASGPSVDGLSNWRFDSDEPERLLGNIAARIPATRDRDRGELIAWNEVFQLLKKHKISLGRFAHDVLVAGPVPLSASDGRGLARFSFSKEEIVGYIFAHTDIKIGVEENSTPDFTRLALTLEELMRRNGCMYPRGLPRHDQDEDNNGMSAGDLARIAMTVFRRFQLSEVTPFMDI